jgi:hypothetical protein
MNRLEVKDEADTVKCPKPDGYVGKQKDVEDEHRTT